MICWEKIPTVWLSSGADFAIVLRLLVFIPTQLRYYSFAFKFRPARRPPLVRRLSPVTPFTLTPVTLSLCDCIATNCHSGPKSRKESHYPLAKPYNWEWRTSEYVLESVLYPSSRYITPNLCMGVFRPWWCRSEEKEALLYIQHHMCGHSHTSFYLIW